MLCTQEAVLCSYQKWSYIGKQANGIEKSPETDSNVYEHLLYDKYQISAAKTDCVQLTAKR